MDPLRPSTLRPAPRFDRRCRPRCTTPPRPRPRLLILLGLVVLAAGLLVPPAPLRAAGVVGNGTPGSCTETNFTNALNDGGLITLNCGPAPHTIQLTSERGLTEDTIIDGGGLIILSGGNSTPLLYVSGGRTVELRKLTVSDGFNAVRDGGALRNDGSLKLIDTVFRANETSDPWSGGAIVSFGTLEITNSTFENNRGANAGGAAENFGGGIYNAGDVNVSNTRFSNNSVGDGGSRTDNRGGGAIANLAGGVSSIVDGKLDNNRACHGGAILNRGRLALNRMVINVNQATAGGGIANSSAELTADNTTISGNQASSSGGGVLDQNGTVALTNVTLANTTNFGLVAPVEPNTSNLTLVNTLLAGNQYGNCSTVRFSQLSSQCGLSDDVTCVWTGSGNRSSTDARLAALADNGGGTLTHLAQAGSPAIDGGTGSGCPASDQRGVARPQGAGCDIGAVEIGPPPAVPPSPSPSASPAPATFRALVPLVQR